MVEEVERSSSTDETVSARERILNAAEQLFTERGFAAASMRAIAQLASVPLGSVNYHFGSKQKLMEAVYERALGGDGTRRLHYLDRLEQKAGPEALSVQAIVEAYLGSALRLTRKSNISGAVFKQLMGRAFYDPASRAELFFPEEYRGAVDRYRQAFARALPELPQEELVWRMYFFVGLVAYVMAGKDVMRMTEFYQLADAGDEEAILRLMVPFVTAGFLAPSSH